MPLSVLTGHPGFEYWANPGNPEEGFITWQSNGQPSYTLGANAVGPDTGDDGSMVGQRRIPEEPMVNFSHLSYEHVLTMSYSPLCSILPSQVSKPLTLVDPC